MTRSRVVHIALLRGINVGRAKRIAMADLRAIVEGLGYGDVKTILNSGNVVYTATGSPAQSARKIENAVKDQLGITSKVTGLSSDELETIIEKNPLPEGTASPSRFLISIVADPADTKPLGELLKKNWGSEKLAVRGRAVYQLTPDGILESTIIEAAGRALGDRATARNWATLGKISAVVAQLQSRD